MTKIMPETKQHVRYQWIRGVLEEKISLRELLTICPFSERTIKYWLARYRAGGLAGLTDHSTRPHISPNKTPQWVEDKILSIREEKGVCGKKIFWELEKERISIGERTVTAILKRTGNTRTYRKAREYIIKKAPVTTPGEVVEIDIKYGVHFGFGRWWYQYTAIDLASKWRFLKGYDNRENDYSIDFLASLQKRAHGLFAIKAVKTDNDSVFTNRITGYTKSQDPINPRIHDFDQVCQARGITHYLIAPGKPTQNGTVERSHRTDKAYFYRSLTQQPKTIEEYNYKLRLWNNWYNDLPHCSLEGLSPNDYLRKVQNVPA